MPRNHTENANTAWSTNLSVPQDGERITADSANAGDGPVNPAFGKLADRDAALAMGKVTHRAVHVKGPGEEGTNPTDGTLIVEGSAVFGGAVLLKGALFTVAGLAGTTKPTTSIPSGTWTFDMLMCMGAVINSIATLWRGFNIEDVARRGGEAAGVYEVTSRTAPAWTDAIADGDPVPIPTIVTINQVYTEAGKFYSARTTKVGAGAGKLKTTVAIRVADGTLTDTAFSLVLLS